MGKAPIVGHHGVAPGERAIEQLLDAGIVNVDKPKGPSSHQVTAWTRDIFGAEKAGHLGTLDPGVTGVLLVGLGRAVRGLDALLLSDKEYVCLMHLHQEVPKQKLHDTFKIFVGEIFQTPPLRSAVKRQRRSRTIYEIEVLEIAGRSVLFRVRCESGTYIRTLCVDVGEALGVGANMRELRRTMSAGFSEKDSHPLQEVKDAWQAWKQSGDDKALRNILLPMETLFERMPKVTIKDSAVDAICHGASLAVVGVTRADASIASGGMVAMLTAKGEAIALGRAMMNAEGMAKTEEGIAVKVERVLMQPGTYPRMWKDKGILPK
ncbi:MAG: RNA-guided pseudouridylation complex pseudouridine synthase subunit Cbf5 [Euryarchaeota archaeon]|nr:RNA-guided pseudouridylation complex pseudouridine synthase subunit Cbf5 [Euryarchaeota archaeon]